MMDIFGTSANRTRSSSLTGSAVQGNISLAIKENNQPGSCCIISCRNDQHDLGMFQHQRQSPSGPIGIREKHPDSHCRLLPRLSRKLHSPSITRLPLRCLLDLQLRSQLSSSPPPQFGPYGPDCSPAHIYRKNSHILGYREENYLFSCWVQHISCIRLLR